MFPSVQSIFLQSLGHAIANSLWQMAGIWLLFMALNTVFRFSAAQKYRVAVTAQFTGFAGFIISFIAGYLPQAYAMPVIIGGRNGSLLGTWTEKATAILPWLSLIYLALMAVMITRWIIGYRQTKTISAQGLQKMPGEWRFFIKKIASHLYIRKEVRIFLSEHVTTPLTTGFLKPVILVPLASINHLTTAQLEAVLLHEMAHIRRHDYLMNMILSVMELLLFFNPFMHLLSKDVRKERENSCDDWVLQFRYDATDYAQALVRIASLQAKPVFAMAASGKKQELLFRVKRMIGQQDNRYVQCKHIPVLLIAAGLLLCTTFLFSNNGSAEKNSTVKKHLDINPGTTVAFTAIQPISPVAELPAVTVTACKKIKKSEPVAPSVPALSAEPAIAIAMAPLAPVFVYQLPEMAELPESAPVSKSADVEKAMASINNVDLEKIINDVFRSVHFNEDDRKELGKIRSLLLSARNRELLRTDLKEKQRTRVPENNFTMVSLDNSEPNPSSVQPDKLPVVVRVSFKMSPPDDAREIARIKLAILNQLRLVMERRNAVPAFN